MSTFYNNKNIIELYTKIPDYTEVKHLGNAEFINKIEKLKEEFRQIRSSLYEDSDHDNEVDSLVESTQNLNLKNKHIKYDNLKANTNRNETSGNNPAYLSISSCQLYRPSEGLLFKRPNSTEQLRKYGSTLQLERYDSISPNDSGHSSDDNLSETANMSRWSSSPELSKRKFKHYIPPQNIETRLAVRKTQNKKSNFQIPEKDNKPTSFTRKSHPVPSHVTKPLFYKIMLKNKRRSDKVKQQSKQRLMAQVKPFAFSKSPLEKGLHVHKQDDPYKDILNNERPIARSKKLALHQNINNKLGSFTAKPAPPRNKALMAALRLKEQQDYRELKKQLRAEALMNLSTLPPSMEARHQTDKSNKAKLEILLKKLQEERTEKHRPRIRKESDGNTNGTISDEERFFESPFPSDQDQPSSSPKDKDSKKKTYFKNNDVFDYAKEKDRSRLFETTSNDNHASRLRIEAAKKKEEARIKREEEEQLRLMKIEKKRNKLRDWHINVWRRACSYSSNQDIAMRRQLREVASIVERENFKKDMSNMLTRVRSAPLLLQGVRERKFEPCQKHKQEMLQLSGRSSKFNTPRLGFGKEKYFSRINWTSLGEDAKLNRGGGGDKSETVALAEGSVTTSDNESLDNDSDHESENEVERLDNHNLNEYAALEKEVDDIIRQGESLA